ncbi:MAG: RnfH family protein [Gammaproteobacteria bacterium]|nr:RnfH family protein [Gammaproteobacteria bacterium]
MVEQVKEKQKEKQKEKAEQKLDGKGLIPVEVAYATPDKQTLLSLEVPEGTTALEAVRQSGIADEYSSIDIDQDPMGIFSNPLNGKDWPLPAEYALQSNDRVEIYRPLQIDPKQARKVRARKE